jgi:hypothetical protein
MISRRITVLALLAALSAAPGAFGRDEMTVVDRLANAAQKAFEHGQYKRAESLYERALPRLEESQTTDEVLAIILKRLGETLLKQGKYPEAEMCLNHAASISQALGIPDAELVGDQAMISQLYKPVDTELLGTTAHDMLTKANLSSFFLVKKDDGANHVQIQLPERFTKQIDNPDVDQLGFDRVITFDIISLPDGQVKIENIKGLRVRAKMWVTILQSLFKPAGDGEHDAEITAGKMGVTKTVNTKLTANAYAPIAGLVAQLIGAITAVTQSNGTAPDSSTASPGSSTPSSGSTSSGASTTATGSTTTPGTSTAPSAPAKGTADTGSPSNSQEPQNPQTGNVVDK